MLRTVSVRGCSSRCQALCIPLIAAGAALLVAGCSARGAGVAHPLTIAVVGPMSGPAAGRGGYREEAARLAVDEVNGLESLKGRKLQLSVYDDGDDPGRAANWHSKSQRHPHSLYWAA